MTKRVLVTGGAGYIGSHACLCLLERGFEVSVVDDLSNGHYAALERVMRITGRELRFHALDLRDRDRLQKVFRLDGPFNAVLHFAGLKAVGDSVRSPLRYYDNNLGSVLSLLTAMQSAGVARIVFSSSATVYGQPEQVPIATDAAVCPGNPYGHTKAMTEQILRDLRATDSGWRVGLLRYFNPIGAHPSGMIGEHPRGAPSNLLPGIARVAVGKAGRLQVFGGDYPTADGTGVRDYIHVMDLVEAHVAALSALDEEPLLTVNLGTGRGYSVLEVIRTFERVSGRSVPFEIVARRPGDIAVCYTDPSAAHLRLHWKASRGLEEMCADAWRWQRDNPDGYDSADGVAPSV